MKRILTVIFTFSLIATSWNSSPAYAASQDECAIWLCLPGGFPSGCSGAKSAWKKRIKKGKPPLPAFSSCAVDSGSDGRYEMGVERFESCPVDHVSIDRFSYQKNAQARHCISESCVSQNPNAMNLLNQGFEQNIGCSISYAPQRAKPNYVKMWFDNEYLGQFFYQ